jgi:hypothetical protein
VDRTLARLVLSPAQASIRAGGSLAYSAMGHDAAGHDLGHVTARTSFSIRPDGSCAGASCTATKPGRHTVTGTVHQGHRAISATAALQVGPSRGQVAPARRPVGSSRGQVASTRRQAGRPQSLARLVLSPAREFIPSGGSVTYIATGYDNAGHTLGNVTAQTTFSIRFSAAKTSRSIRLDGSCTGATCTATKLGRHTVTGTADLGDSTISGTAALQVVPRRHQRGRPQPLARLELIPSTARIVAGDRQAYRTEGYDAAGHDLGDYTIYTVFSISPDGSCAGASCTATVAGRHIVTGTVVGTEVIGTAILEVVAGPLAKLELRPNRARIVAGGKVTYHADGFDAYHNPLGEVTDQTSFTIDPPGSCAGATCTATQLRSHTVTGILVGNPAIRGTARLLVVPGPGPGKLASLELRPNPAVIEPGGKVSYIVHGLDADGHRLDGLGDLAAYTVFRIDRGGSCTNAACTATKADTYTVTGTLDLEDRRVTGKARLQVTTTPSNCAPSARDVRDLQVTPGKGTPGTQVHITARLDRKFANCPQRIILDGSGSGVDTTVGPDGSISVRRSVPDDAKPGITTVRLATTDGRTLAQASFQIIPKPRPSWLRWLLFAIAALLLLVLAVLAILAERERRRRWARQHVRAEPHPSSDDVTVDQDPKSAPTFSVRLQPHPDAGTQTLEEED